MVGTRQVHVHSGRGQILGGKKKKGKVKLDVNSVLGAALYVVLVMWSASLVEAASFLLP